MLKKLKSLLIFFIITIVVILSIYSYSIASSTGTVNGSAVNVRENPTTDSKIKDTIYRGKKVDIVEKAGDWYKVSYDQKDGYIRGDLLDVVTTNETVPDKTEPEKPEENVTPNVQPEENIQPTENKGLSTIKLGENQLNEGMKIIMSEPVDLKILPSVNSKIIAKVSAQKEVTVSEVINNWCKIETEEYAGWLRIEK